ncbi:3-phosphoshikimate 1-carboxyvinyltransferase [Gramella sp. AN32]|uniref:3-phosphoshikimate 1-carboxyvinyltransferase n=1 Tax=Christiangramia antarctica TaxID=2058158 RepID=A0ABW5X3L9_9FLAO|nr:3-phosphoshikimate 1-carboxyvinyltransferase [Gramella sp. AN32]MCM4157197.1 3-phosphoshikimate 1-carboxyvinyltransferase [Gramella sp. AN32]
MNLAVSNTNNNIQGNLKITGSKSESNRLLILQALYPGLKIENLSNSDDSQVMAAALQKGNGEIDIHHAGTAMRFLTAYFASREGVEVILTGSKRMRERPIRLLVDALQRMGADIEYTQDEGYPPLKIRGKKISTKTVSLAANVSSQYISALMLVAASLPNGLEIILNGQVTSEPYILMTLGLLKQVGIDGEYVNGRIFIQPTKDIAAKTIAVESDWSSASYFYSLAAISETAEIKLSNFNKNSKQGDSCLSQIYEKFGVVTEFGKNSITLKKEKGQKPNRISEDLRNAPDIAQTIAVTCLALNMGCELKGLHTLKIKETDRLEALKAEIEKFGAEVKISKDSLTLRPCRNLKEGVKIATYNDHRMAMAFAPLGLRTKLIVEDAGVVSKSYPEFWSDFEKLGFQVSETN